jgi:hypothetical protein
MEQGNMSQTFSEATDRYQIAESRLEKINAALPLIRQTGIESMIADLEAEQDAAQSEYDAAKEAMEDMVADIMASRGEDDG